MNDGEKERAWVRQPMLLPRPAPVVGAAALSASEEESQSLELAARVLSLLVRFSARPSAQP